MLNPRLEPLRVPDHIKRVKLTIMNASQPIPIEVPIFMGTASTKIGLRFAGGCSDMAERAKLRMLYYFPEALVPVGLPGFCGIVASGGNRGLNPDGTLNIMITEVPGALVAAAPEDILGVCSLPRTGELGIIAESRLTLDQNDDMIINPGVHMVVLVQDDAGYELPWDGDLEMYFKLYQAMVTQGKWKFGFVGFNGGDITKEELLRAAALGWTVFLVAGSGRATDELVGQVTERKLVIPDTLAKRGITPDSFDLEDNSPFEIVDFDDPASLHKAAVRRGFILPNAA